MSNNSDEVFNKIRNDLKRKISTKTPNKSVAYQIKEVIRVRAQLGKDKDDNPYEALNDKYKKIRKGSKLSKLTTAKRSNLTRTGKMFEAMTQRPGKMSVTIYFKDQLSRLKEQWAREGGKGRPIRDFFEVSPKDKKKIDRIVREWIRKNL